MKTETRHTQSRRGAHTSSAPPKTGNPNTLTVAAVMTPQPHTIGRDQTLDVAHRMMSDNGVRHLPVLERGVLVGVLSQRDLYFVETVDGVNIEADVVADAMTQDTYTVAPGDPVSKVAATMADRRLGCAVVVEGGRVVGIFTATDALGLLGA